MMRLLLYSTTTRLYRHHIVSWLFFFIVHYFDIVVMSLQSPMTHYYQAESEILGELDGIEAQHNGVAAEVLTDLQTLSQIVMKDLKVFTYSYYISRLNYDALVRFLIYRFNIEF